MVETRIPVSDNNGVDVPLNPSENDDGSDFVDSDKQWKADGNGEEGQ
jgi:hypothetical protein